MHHHHNHNHNNPSWSTKTCRLPWVVGSETSVVADGTLALLADPTMRDVCAGRFAMSSISLYFGKVSLMGVH